MQSIPRAWPKGSAIGLVLALILFVPLFIALVLDADGDTRPHAVAPNAALEPASHR